MEQIAQTNSIDDAGRQSSSGTHRELRTWARDLIVALGMAMVIIIFFYQPVKVEGTSMAPLISDQERIFINKFVYRFEPIERGDVVVFWYPLDRTKSFIKRVVGLPGDEVEIRRGRVFINGNQLEEPYVPPRYADVSGYGPVRIPAGQYFVMGDHRIQLQRFADFRSRAGRLYLRQGGIRVLADDAIRHDSGVRRYAGQMNVDAAPIFQMRFFGGPTGRDSRTPRHSRTRGRADI